MTAQWSPIDFTVQDLTFLTYIMFHNVKDNGNSPDSDFKIKIALISQNNSISKNKTKIKKRNFKKSV